MDPIRSSLPAQPASDGDGVRIQRVQPGGNHRLTDPFLMLDEIRSANAQDYIAGFPPHPHRGFETITYMRQGSLQHEDNLGHQGLVNSGGAQWMTAGSGVIHSEQPLTREGLFHGFQLWLNLPAAEKMRAPEYHDLQPEDIPRLQLGAHWVSVLAGEFRLSGQTDQLISGPIGDRLTEPQLWDIELRDDKPLQLQLNAQHNNLLYVYEGQVNLGERPLPTRTLLQLGVTEIELQSNHPAGLLVLGGKPLNEPVAQFGPFVMNTREQINQAIDDYNNGTLTDAAT